MPFPRFPYRGNGMDSFPIVYSFLTIHTFLPMISIILPVHNCEDYLQEAIDSVFSQTYQDWELILVDDGSTDASGKICEKAARKSSRVKIIHKKNGGISSARNAGLDSMRGNYVAFLDADDILHPLFLEIMSKGAEEYGCDIMCGGMRNFTGYGSKILLNAHLDVVSSRRKHFFRLLSPVKALKNILYQKKIDCSVCGKLFSSTLWEGLRFREGTRYEDLDIIYQVVLKSTLVGRSFKPLYFYRQHASSFIHTFSLERGDVIDVTERMTHFMDINHPEFSKASRSRHLSANFNILTLLAANRPTIETMEEEEREKATAMGHSCWATIKKLRGKMLLNPRVRIKNKIAILVSYIGGRKLLERLS